MELINARPTADQPVRGPASDDWTDYDQAEIQAVRAQIGAEDAEPVDDSVPVCLRGPWRAVLRNSAGAKIEISSLGEDDDAEVVVLRGNDDAAGLSGITHPDVLFIHTDALSDFADLADVHFRWERAQHVSAAVNAYITNTTASAVDDAERDRELDTLRRLTAHQREQLAEYRRMARDPGMWGEPITQPAWTVQVGCQVQYADAWYRVVRAEGDKTTTTLRMSTGAVYSADADELLQVRFPVVIGQQRLAQLTAEHVRAYETIGSLQAKVELLTRQLAATTRVTSAGEDLPRVSLDETPVQPVDDDQAARHLAKVAGELKTERGPAGPHTTDSDADRCGATWFVDRHRWEPDTQVPDADGYVEYEVCGLAASDPTHTVVEAGEQA